MTHCVMTGWEWGETEQISSDAKDTDNEDRPLSWPAEYRCRGITEAPIFATHQEHITYQCVWSPQTLMHDRVFQISTCRCLQVYGSFSHLLLFQKDSKATSQIVGMAIMAISGHWHASVDHDLQWFSLCFFMWLGAIQWSWWLTCSYSFHFWHEGSQTALNRVFYFENLSSEAVQIAHISEHWIICADQKVISWGEMQYAGSPCMRQTEKKSVQRECGTETQSSTYLRSGKDFSYCTAQLTQHTLS